MRKRTWRSFEEARDFIRSLHLPDTKAWLAFCASEQKPADIPAHPERVYNAQGWAGLTDWLGNGNLSSQARSAGFLPYREAHNFARGLGLPNQKAWKAWAQSGERPPNIPAEPWSVYGDTGWSSLGDWLGTDTVAPQNRTFLLYPEAQAFVRDLNLPDVQAFRDWAKTPARPADLPFKPERTYGGQGWTNWADFLGSTNVHRRDYTYRSFEDARAFARSLGLPSLRDWQTWAASPQRPRDIPADPSRQYAEKGWLDWTDWLDADPKYRRRKGFLPFDEARARMHAQGLTSQAAWHAWCRAGCRPLEVPANPQGYYSKANRGWTGWADFLGYAGRWTRAQILAFLHSLAPTLPFLHPSELLAILHQNGMVRLTRRTAHPSHGLVRRIEELARAIDPEAALNALLDALQQENEAGDAEDAEGGVGLLPLAGTEPDATPSDALPPVLSSPTELPGLRSFEALLALDRIAALSPPPDEDTLEFLVANRVQALWNLRLNAPEQLDWQRLRQEVGGVWFGRVRDRFLAQLQGAESLVLPPGYAFEQNGIAAPPNLMQRLTAFRVLTERRIGNWSGVGAGKTLSAILASRVLDARLTVVIAFNSTLTAWADTLQQVYPDSIVWVKERGVIEVDPNRHTYLLLNFETFQQSGTQAWVEQLTRRHRVDLVVLDEIQFVKQREPATTSKRRQTVLELLARAGAANSKLAVLGMSATPVINNLHEAKALLALILGEPLDSLPTANTLANANRLHQELIRHGIRYRPAYAQTVHTHTPPSDGTELLPALLSAGGKHPLALEQVLLPAKMERIMEAIRPGTLVYTHYVEGMVEPLTRRLEAAGWRVGAFTGEDKSGLAPFLAGRVDVLIGSSALGTGVNGLQQVCNRVVIACLPWTAAEYEQLIGRVYRQGSSFDSVDVIVPQVVLEAAGQTWSWDRMRIARLAYKKTLADAALDGVIPEGELDSPDVLHRKAQAALQTWIQRVEQG